MLRRLRAAKVGTPVLIVSGRTGVDSKIKALGAGADDFMTKPFKGDQFIAPNHAVISRSAGKPQSIIGTGKLVINIDARTVVVDDRPLHLTGKEYGVLELLSLRKGNTVTKDMLLNHLYDGRDEPELKIIDVFVCNLRKKLSQLTGGDHYIETIWGRGYVMRDPILPADRVDADVGRVPQTAAVPLSRMALMRAV